MRAVARFVSGLREDVHGGGVGADGGGVDPGFALLDGVVVDEVAGLEVVGGVEDECRAGARSSAMLAGTRSAMCAWTVTVELKRAIWRRAASALGRHSQGVGLVEENLALEVGGLDEVAVDEGEGADAGAGEQRGGGSARGSAADDGDVGGGESLLAGGADAGEENLAGVAVVVSDAAQRVAWIRRRGCRCGSIVLRRWGLRRGMWQLRAKTLLFRSIGKRRGVAGTSGHGRGFLAS